MTSSSWLALVITVSCFTPSTEVPSLPNETYVYPATVFNATQQICSQETLRQEIINGIKQDSYRYIQEFLSKSCAMIACYLLHGIYCTDIPTPVFKHIDLLVMQRRLAVIYKTQELRTFVAVFHFLFGRIFVEFWSH